MQSLEVKPQSYHKEFLHSPTLPRPPPYPVNSTNYPNHTFYISGFHVSSLGVWVPGQRNKFPDYPYIAEIKGTSPSFHENRWSPWLCSLLHFPAKRAFNPNPGENGNHTAHMGFISFITQSTNVARYKNTKASKIIKGWRCGSSSGVPVLQVQSPEFKT
jgi:hypothetical protein